MKETLEEAIKREYEVRKYNSDFPFEPQSFKLGAKWQQEQDKNKYSEEDMIDFSEWVSLNFRNQHNYLRNLQKSRQGLDVPVDKLRGYFSTKELFELYKNK
jgi:hypothetical protein